MACAGLFKFLNSFKLSNLAYKEIKPLWADQRDFDRPKFIYSWMNGIIILSSRND